MIRNLRAFGAAVGAVGICATSLVAASPASAAEFTTYGNDVNVRAEATTQSSVVGTLPGPTAIDVECQTNGEYVDLGGGVGSSWWAKVPALNGYVTVAYVDIPESKLPGVAECDSDEPPPSEGDMTVEDIQAIVPEKVRDPNRIAEGLPNLNAAMNEAGITTPERKAALVATLSHESNLEYDRREDGDTRTYGGRGFIQLTGDFNYGPAGDYLGIDLLGDPDLAMSIDHSPRIATWYWTVAHDINAMADNLDMGAVNAAIGYPVGDGTEDAARCDVANRALAHFGGSGTFACTRPSIAGMPNPRKVSPEEFAPYDKLLVRASRQGAQHRAAQ
ncbi:glycoside hydrolase family 19 protein [Solicola gregarius]|uniref:Glycoside hydrolase family 19 n=1 Tax=Solicola gregarius TaxID=2908642 RepID=A0AA46TLU3_9ACTN|nr:glycoside hydrolase family 19 protein [Solicola gregarius]UYM07630.1 glycoside hydrolase family 19 [Solicola gregarius]